MGVEERTHLEGLCRYDVLISLSCVGSAANAWVFGARFCAQAFCAGVCVCLRCLVLNVLPDGVLLIAMVYSRLKSG